MSCGAASAAGSQLCSRRVWLVMGPMEMATTPAKGKGMPAARAAPARWVTLEELVKVAASIPWCNAARSCEGAAAGIALR